jgi:hypothetical protein
MNAASISGRFQTARVAALNKAACAKAEVPYAAVGIINSHIFDPNGHVNDELLPLIEALLDPDRCPGAKGLDAPLIARLKDGKESVIQKATADPARNAADSPPARLSP